ncbi:MAG TPA: hypothetical protein ENF87_01035 [Thermoproteales archaeon]|nr:hypothetical protein [Thermoproteales archaeon]
MSIILLAIILLTLTPYPQTLTVNVIQDPLKPVAGKPVLVYYKGVPGVAPNFTVKISVKLDLKISTEVIEERGNGSKLLKLKVRMPSQNPAEGAYVKVYAPLIHKVIAAGFTDSNGMAYFNLSPGLYDVHAYYDKDGDGLYEYFGVGFASICSCPSATWSYAEVILRKTPEVFNLKGTYWSFNYTLKMFELPGAWYVASIPSLPSLQGKIEDKYPLEPGEILYVNVRSNFSYTISIRDIILYSGEGVVEDFNGVNNPPKVLMYVANSFENFNSTLSLSPKGWCWPSSEPLNIGVIVLDDGEVIETKLYYTTNGKKWNVTKLKAEKTVFDRLGEDFYKKVLKQLETNMTILRINLNLEPVTGLYYYRASLRSTSGTYLLYKAVAKDSQGSTSYSLTGLCYFYKDFNPKARVLIIDPYVKLWVLRTQNKTTLQLLNQFTSLNRSGEQVFTPFHHWEYLGEDFEIRIASPDENITEILEEYNPKIVYISNLYTNNLPGLREWNTSKIILEVLRHVRERHGGIVVSHGTLGLLNGTVIQGNPLVAEILGQKLYPRDFKLGLWIPWNGSLGGSNILGIPPGMVYLQTPYSGVPAYTSLGWQYYFKLDTTPLSESELEQVKNFHETLGLKWSNPTDRQELVGELDEALKIIPPEIALTSPDGRAGIIVYDKYWDEHGYRAVYISFELESGLNDYASMILKRIVEWAGNWSYRESDLILDKVRLEAEAGKIALEQVQYLGETVLIEKITEGENLTLNPSA